MTKELFIKSIESLQKQYEHDDKCADAFAVILPNDYTSLYDNHWLFNTIVEILVTETNDKDGWIDYFIYEIEFGTSWEEGMVTLHGKDIKLQTAEDLWSIITQ